MNTTTRKTCACSMETLDEKLKSAIRAHGSKYGLADASYTLTPDQDLNIPGRYTDKNKTGITFIVLDAESDGQKFRHVLQEAMSQATKS